jgi:hypothetical protein
MKVDAKKKVFINPVDKSYISQKNQRSERPNIDHLMKRILVERRLEKKKNLVMMSLVFLVFLILIFFFTK